MSHRAPGDLIEERTSDGAGSAEAERAQNKLDQEG